MSKTKTLVITAFPETGASIILIETGTTITNTKMPLSWTCWTPQIKDKVCQLYNEYKDDIEKIQFFGNEVFIKKFISQVEDNVDVPVEFIGVN